MEQRDVSVLPKVLATAGPAAVVLLFGVLLLWSAQRVEESDAWVEHTHQVINEIERLVGAVARAESSERGYLITGEPHFLAPFQAAVREARTAAATLRHLTGDNPSQQERLDALCPLLEQRIETLIRLIELRRQRGLSAVAPEVEGASGTAGRIRGIAAAMQAEERRLLALRYAADENNRKGIAVIILLGTVGAAALALFTNLLLGRSAADRGAALRVAEDRAEALRESEERFRATFEQAAVGIAHVAPDGRWVRANDRLSEIAGRAKEELLATTIQAITHPEDLATDLALTRKLLAGQIPWYTLEKRYLRPDGSVVPIVLTVSLKRDAAGRPDYLIKVVEDNTIRKRAEEELRDLTRTLELRVGERTRDLAEINAELEAFTYTVSHDLRAPLRAMQGFAQALVEDYGDRLDAEGIGYTRYISSAAAQMDGLIQDLLAYSRLGRAELRLHPVDLGEVVAEARERLNPEIAERNARIEISGPLPRACGDRTVVGQVVQNLLANAIKFVAPGVRPCVLLRADARDRWIRLWVEDNGIGVAPEHQERIYGVFERLHGVESYAGTGIGLAIVRRGAERLGGRAGVESQPGAGSRFWIELLSECECR